MSRIDSRDVDLTACRKDCKFFKQDPVHELCTHDDSRYSVAGKVDFHTIGHMRTVGTCGEAGRNYRRQT